MAGIETTLTATGANACLTPDSAVISSKAALTICTLSSVESTPALSTQSSLKRLLAVCPIPVTLDVESNCSAIPVEFTYVNQ